MKASFMILAITSAFWSVFFLPPPPKSPRSPIISSAPSSAAVALFSSCKE